jgi:hypothetical protein
MKKLLFFVLAVSVFSSCGEDVEFNNPTIQAYKNDVLFSGVNIQAYQSAATGRIRMVATTQSEQLELKIGDPALGTYYLGTTNTNNKATYTSSLNDINVTYATVPVQGSVSKVDSAIVTGGSGYTSDCTLINGQWVCGTSHTTTGGSGVGLTVSLITTNGVVTSAKVASPGNNYYPGDVITVNGGTTDAKLKVLNTQDSNGEIVLSSTKDGYLSGTFKFNAVKLIGPQTEDAVINFQHGTFYNVPVVPEP